MSVFNNTKTSKKFILIIAFLILFNFCCPIVSRAALGFDDIVAAPAALFFAAEKGVLSFLNNIFTDDNYQSSSEVTASSGLTNGGDAAIMESLKIYLTPETIIKGKFILFDANIFKEVKSSDEYYDAGIGKVVSGKSELRNIISGWYYALRNFAIIALLSVLVYVGIRMVISTIAQDKAKYKSMLKDWFIALCLLIFMHYIMIGILNISSLITEALGGGENVNHVADLTKKISGILQEEYEGNTYALEDPDNPGKVLTIGDAYALILVLGGIILYTFIFAVKYIKREFTIIFLILLGPISCITYPIDKISDGKAQAYNRWFTEFLYQVIIQPFHLLLYIVLIGSATELASVNVIYALVCFAIMIPAEKFIKEMFGFKDKLGSPLGAFAGGALASKAVSTLLNKGKNGESNRQNEIGDNDSPNKGLPPKTVDKDSLIGGQGGQDSNTPESINSTNETAISTPDSDTSASDNNEEEHPELNSAVETDKDSLEEKTNEDDLNEQQNQLLENGEKQTDINNDSNSKDNIGTNDKKEIPQQSMWKSLRATRNQRVSKRWGSTRRGQRWKNRTKKGVKSLVKGGLKAAAIGTVGAVSASAALLTGNGKEALGIAGGIGAYAGSKAWKGGKRAIKGATGAVKDYYGNLRDDDQREKKAFNDFCANKKQQDLASYGFMERNGYEPGYKELNQEMKDRFALWRYGLSDDEINESIPRYQELKESGVPEKEALNETVLENQLGNLYKGKFGKRKDMTEALEATTKTFTDEGVDPTIAEEKARELLTQAAKMKKETIVLPNSVTGSTTRASQKGKTTRVSLNGNNEPIRLKAEAPTGTQTVTTDSTLILENEGQKYTVAADSQSLEYNTIENVDLKYDKKGSDTITFAESSINKKEIGSTTNYKNKDKVEHEYSTDARVTDHNLNKTKKQVAGNRQEESKNEVRKITEKTSGGITRTTITNMTGDNNLLNKKQDTTTKNQRRINSGNNNNNSKK